MKADIIESQRPNSETLVLAMDLQQVLFLLTLMLSYVVGSRRLMSPEVLQPMAYCTNPGL